MSRGLWIPNLHLESPTQDSSSALRPISSTLALPRLHPGLSSLRLRSASSSLWLHLGQSSPWPSKLSDAPQPSTPMAPPGSSFSPVSFLYSLPPSLPGLPRHSMSPWFYVSSSPPRFPLVKSPPHSVRLLTPAWLLHPSVLQFILSWLWVIIWLLPSLLWFLQSPPWLLPPLSPPWDSLLPAPSRSCLSPGPHFQQNPLSPLLDVYSVRKCFPGGVMSRSRL